MPEKRTPPLCEETSTEEDRHRIFTIRTKPLTAQSTNTRKHRSLPYQRDTIRSARYKQIKHSRKPQTPIFATNEAHRKYPSANTITMSDQNPFQSSAATSNQENQPQETQQQQEEKKAGADKSQGDDSLYVSPSDAIMSPASQKLSSFKQRQINKCVYVISDGCKVSRN